MSLFVRSVGIFGRIWSARRRFFGCDPWKGRRSPNLKTSHVRTPAGSFARTRRVSFEAAPSTVAQGRRVRVQSGRHGKMQLCSLGLRVSKLCKP